MTASKLARGCHMPRSRVSDLLAGRRRITADTALRLAAFFCMEPEAWMTLQADWDLSQRPLDDVIVPLDPPGFLLGTLGATPIPARRPARPSLAPPTSSPPSPSTAENEACTHVEVRYPDGTRALVRT